ncbi:chondroitin sulfate synthase [Lycorma delicatula]|uniref:chondroitin sulfate synthase n=1 Tax=Lycorma delicatula TaxID=130591 RepID=UPI003F519DC4
MYTDYNQQHQPVSARYTTSASKNSHNMMSVRRCKLGSAGFGILLGLTVGLLVARTGQNNRCVKKEPRAWRQTSILENDPLAFDEEQNAEGISEINNGPGLLFVGVMTAKKYLDTRAAAVYDTWGKEIPGKLAFFSSEDSLRPVSHPRLPLVPLPGVDDSYPPQKKSFLMLQYMWQHYGDKFEWFLRADDDIYVRTDRLAFLLRSVDSRKAYFIGQAGRGKQEEFGSLSLEYDENFCMGGPGVILSRETLSRVVPHIKYCLKNLYTTHEDVELGRCVRKFARVSCTWSYEMQTILYHNSSGVDAFTGNLKLKEVHRAITLHPIKQHYHLYRIHNYMKGLKIHDAQQQTLELHRDLITMSRLLQRDIYSIQNEGPFPKRLIGDSYLLGLTPSLNKFHPHNEDDVLQWDFIARSVFSHTNLNPRRRIESPLREGLDDVIREVMEMINQYSRQRGRVIDFKEILYGYHRLNPLYGTDYILDMLLVYKKYRGRKMTVPVRRHAYLQQQFAGLEMHETVNGVEVTHPNSDNPGEGTEEEEGGEEEKEGIGTGDENSVGIKEGLIRLGESLPGLLLPGGQQTAEKSQEKLINFIVPLSGRFKTFVRFINIFEDVCLKTREHVTLIVVLFPSDNENTINNTLNLVRELQARHSWTKITVIPVFDTFARALALHIGAGQVSEPDDLLFFVDVDMIFNVNVLRRIRMNTIKGKLAYFPIVYSEFDPKVVYNTSSSFNHFLINEDSGYWRQYGFGIASVYKTDLIQVGGFDTTIKGWGKEDVNLFDKFVSASSNISVFRAVDPDLIHAFHVVQCDPNLTETQLQMCRATRFDTYGSVKQLANILNKNRNKILSFATDRYKKVKFTNKTNNNRTISGLNNNIGTGTGS